MNGCVEMLVSGDQTPPGYQQTFSKPFIIKTDNVSRTTKNTGETLCVCTDNTNIPFNIIIIQYLINQLRLWSLVSQPLWNPQEPEEKM